MIFSAAVIAGGRSIRMGTDKGFLHFGKETLLERQLRCLRECGAEELLLSGRLGVDYSGVDARVVYDEEADAGPLAGVAATLKAASREIVLVLAVDMPGMTAPMLGKILSHCSENRGIVPMGEDGWQPLAAAYPKTALALAKRHLVEKQYSMKKFVTAVIAEGLARPLALEPFEQTCFANWNRPSDLANLR